MIGRACKFLLRLVSAFVVFSAVLVATQPLLIFPGAFMSGPGREPPPEVERFTVETHDGEKLDVWRLGAGDGAPAAVISHGNGGDVRNFFPYQQWLAHAGVTSYSYDYRGYGRSTGWPGEEGIYIDTDAVWRFAAEREGIDRSQLIAVGISIGSAPAAWAAERSGTEVLMLLAPFTSLERVVKEQRWLGYLSRFLWYEMPTEKFVRDWRGRCLAIVHGRRDFVIPFANGEALARINPEGVRTVFRPSASAGHNDLLSRAVGELDEALNECLRSRKAAHTGRE